MNLPLWTAPDLAYLGRSFRSQAYLAGFTATGRYASSTQRWSTEASSIKLINNPVVVSRGRPDIYAEILARLDHLYREVARVYIASGGDGAGFVNLCIRSQKFGPETVEFLRCRVFQNPDTIATHILARLRGSEPVAYAYQQVKSRFRSQRIMNLADALQAHKFKCGVYPLANKLAACAELHYAASICVEMTS